MSKEAWNQELHNILSQHRAGSEQEMAEKISQGAIRVRGLIYVFNAEMVAAKVGELMAKGAEVNCTDPHKSTPLHKASANGFEKACRILLQHGADVHAENDIQQTPLHLAAFYKNREICDLLTQNDANLDAVGTRGITPKHYLGDGADNVTPDTVAIISPTKLLNSQYSAFQKGGGPTKNKL